MQQVYTVILEEAYDGEVCSTGVWAYEEREDAENKLLELKAIADRDDRFDTKEVEEKDYIDYYNDGWYDRWHFHAHIEQMPIMTHKLAQAQRDIKKRLLNKLETEFDAIKNDAKETD